MAHCSHALRGLWSDRAPPHARRHPRQHHALLADEYRVFATRLYWENNADFFNAKNITIPSPSACFPKSSTRPPERAYPTTSSTTTIFDRGGYSAAWEQPEALYAYPTLDEFVGRVSDSGEGRWTSIAAIDEGVPAPILTTALYSRFGSRGLDEFADKRLSAMPKGFGGHAEKPS
jgi:6-phosphogluconate dehydrogenase, C-terminal domain